MKKKNMILAGAAALILGGCSKQEEPAPVIRPVRTLRVAENAKLGGRVFPGRAEAVLAVDIAFEVPGQLIERPIQVGDNVKAGQVLARLDPRDYENSFESLGILHVLSAPLKLCEPGQPRTAARTTEQHASTESDPCIGTPACNVTRSDRSCRVHVFADRVEPRLVVTGGSRQCVEAFVDRS